ncbi:hypothetical protein NQ317_004138 [Molorchus minor]|uniref:Protein hunchback n=1 Tax=Molorchus minor TaxID=1323400 RepID=A0ABQ9J5H0_9CUCU|nr:hypothetical protein NQ317_004138 [Molorchus minor]
METVTCASCVGFVSNYVNFEATCKGTEEKINLYRESQQDEYVIKLSDVLTFLGEGIWYNNENIKKEGPDDNLNGFMGVHVKEVETFKCDMCEYQSKRKGTLNRHLLFHKDISEVQTFKCKMCEFQTRYKRSLKKHSLLHKDISEVQMFKCEMCEYQTRYKRSLKKHVLRHKDSSKVQVFKCEMCEFQTRYKRSLKKTLATSQGHFRSANIFHPTMESVTCASCMRIVNSYCNFEAICKGTEEKINLYREIQQDEYIIKLSNVLTFLGEGIWYNNENIKQEGPHDNLEYSFMGVDVKEEVELLDLDEKCKQKKGRNF